MLPGRTVKTRPVWSLVQDCLTSLDLNTSLFGAPEAPSPLAAVYHMNILPTVKYSLLHNPRQVSSRCFLLCYFFYHISSFHSTFY